MISQDTVLMEYIHQIEVIELKKINVTFYTNNKVSFETDNYFKTFDSINIAIKYCVDYLTNYTKMTFVSETKNEKSIKEQLKEQSYF